jgi:hypothetical protein
MSHRAASDPTDFYVATFSGRTMRWYEWLLALALLALAAGVRAESAYRCDAADGAVTYQAIPCGPDNNERRIAFDARPSVVVAPDYAVAAPRKLASYEHASNATNTHDADEHSYECRASDGEVFYRHSGCPHSLPAPPGMAKGKHGADTKTHITVSARPIPRGEACAAIHRAGAIGRNGHTLDDVVSTYDRNLGRDPCK